MKNRRLIFLLLALAVAVCAIPYRQTIRNNLVSTIQVSKGKKSVADRLREFGDPVRERLLPHFREIGVEYPPKHLTLVGLKGERVLELWVSDSISGERLLKTYPILGASGGPGPKLAEGDLQVPEGLYQIESLNPNSSFHLALRVNYPNDFDKLKGSLDGRVSLGCDIMIHGSTASIGCLAMGDEAAEELFVLAALAGTENIDVILSPVDFRTRDLPGVTPKMPAWTPELYAGIKQALRKLPVAKTH